MGIYSKDCANRTSRDILTMEGILCFNGAMDYKLTDKQEKFCQAIADGMNQSDAYRSAFTTKKKGQALAVIASVLAASSKITERIKELQDEIAKKNLWTRADSVRVLVKIVKKEKEASGNKINAIKELNQMHGFNNSSGDMDSYVAPVSVTIQVKSAKRNG